MPGQTESVVLIYCNTAHIYTKEKLCLDTWQKQPAPDNYRKSKRRQTLRQAPLMSELKTWHCNLEDGKKKGIVEHEEQNGLTVHKWPVMSNSTALWHPNAPISEISKLHNLPLQHKTIKGFVKRRCSKCNQAKQSCARMTDTMEKGKIGLLIIAHQYSNNKPFHSPNIPFFGYDI